MPIATCPVDSCMQPASAAAKGSMGRETALPDTSLHKCIPCYHVLCRLKAAQGSKTMTSLLALGCQRRILLTGTPVQNNLDEFFGKSTRVLRLCLTPVVLLSSLSHGGLLHASSMSSKTTCAPQQHVLCNNVWQTAIIICQLCTASLMGDDCLQQTKPRVVLLVQPVPGRHARALPEACCTLISQLHLPPYISSCKAECLGACVIAS